MLLIVISLCIKRIISNGVLYALHLAAKVNFLKVMRYVLLNSQKTNHGENNAYIIASVQALQKLH